MILYLNINYNYNYNQTIITNYIRLLFILTIYHLNKYELFTVIVYDIISKY